MYKYVHVRDAADSDNARALYDPKCECSECTTVHGCTVVAGGKEYYTCWRKCNPNTRTPDTTDTRYHVRRITSTYSHLGACPSDGNRTDTSGVCLCLCKVENYSSTGRTCKEIRRREPNKQPNCTAGPARRTRRTGSYKYMYDATRARARVCV